MLEKMFKRKAEKKPLKAVQGVVNTGRGVGMTFTGTMDAFRGSLDWAKPSLDKIIDTTAVVVGGNAVLSAGIYGLGKGWDAAVQTVYPDLVNILPQDVETVAKAAAYLGIYSLANWKVILPLAKKVAKRSPTPSWLGYGKTVAIAGLTWLVLANSTIPYNAKNAWNELSKVEDSKTFFQLFNKKSMATIDDYLSGDKIVQAVLNSTTNARNFLVGDPLENEASRIAGKNANPSFKYTGQVSKDAAAITKRGIPTTPEQLAYIARLVYFECGDAKLKTKKEKMKGCEAVAHVMFNRLRFEKKHKVGLFSPDNTPTLYEVAFYNKKSKKTGAIVHQFSAIDHQRKYFKPHKDRENWDLYENGKINVDVGRMNSKRAKMAYNATVKVLKGARDFTHQSLYYQNKIKSDKWNQNWGPKRGMVRRLSIGSHDFYSIHHNSPQYRKILLGPRK